ncbi:MAG: hypothetical protein OSB00_09030 [Sphingomonas bacterium]|nr:hypothetical protein [Sphingomonas bacterium]
MRILSRFARLATAAVFVTIAGCIPQPPKAPPPARQPMAPAPPQTPAPVAMPTGEWRDWPMTPGDWVYRQDARGSIALFGPVGADALVTLRCDRSARRVYLSVRGTNTQPMTVRTTSVSRVVPVQPTGGTPPYVAAAIAPTDTLMEAIGFSRGRFALIQAGAAPLVVPPYAEVERVTQDCRG